MCLRILRSYRLKLLHEFCDNVFQEIHLDSIKVQVLQTSNILRQKASLLPINSGRLFTLGQGTVEENISCFARQ